MQSLQEKPTYSITKKGQVTIPRALRDKFGLSAGDEVVFESDKDTIKVKPANTTLASVYGSVKPLTKKISLKRMREIALEDKLNAVR